jgi:protein-tyrosine phosphatase
MVTQRKASETFSDPRRHVPLSGASNVRDLGGYATADGRRVRWGRVYRGGALNAATSNDIANLIGRGLRVVCDFRSGPERASAPNMWAAKRGIEMWGLADSDIVGDSRDLLEGSVSTAEQTRAIMIRTYERIPFDHAPSYAATFSRIARGNLPLLFHCSAGKDRSGVAAALLLTVLGVSHDDILADYLLSANVQERIEESFVADPRHEKAVRNSTRAWGPLMESDPRYLEAMFRAVEVRCGSVRAYFETNLAIDATALASLRGEMLE